MAPSPLWDLGFKSNNCHNAIMGRTIPSYRIASQIKIWKWRPFRKALDKRDRKVFGEMLSIPRFYNSAGTMACRPVLIHTIIMSIIFEHYKQLRKIGTIQQDHKY
jgi:hypothetical protein